MTNNENQKSRDNEKWVESQKRGYDMSGNMSWCHSCEFSTTCQTSPSGMRCDYGGTMGDFEKTPYPCATAYNRMKRKEYTDSKNRFKRNCIEKSIKFIPLVIAKDNNM